MATETDNKDTAEGQETLLVMDKHEKKVRAVSRITPEGNMETVAPSRKNTARFITVDRGGDLFSNFFSNFMSQLQNPTRFSFFVVPKRLACEMAPLLSRVLEKATTAIMPLNQISIPSLVEEKNNLNQDTMETTERNADAAELRYKPEQVNWEALASMGLDRDRLEKLNLLEPLLKGYKTNELVPLTLTMGNAVVRMDARLSLQPNDSGEIVVAMHGIRKEPNLNYSFFGHEFTPEDKQNLLSTGNMGRVVDLYNQRDAQYYPSVVSVDRMTNELVACRAEWMRIPNEIKGVKLDDFQKQALQEGKAIHLEGMISKKGEPFDASVQFNADKRYVEFQFDRSLSNAKAQDLTAPRIFRDRELTDEQYGRFKEGQTVYVSGLIDRQGKEYNGYITFNKETGKTDFSFQNPDKAQKATQAEESKTQVAVNSEGKTNEATKALKEPLNTRQQEPDTAKQQEQQAPARKGRKM